MVHTLFLTDSRNFNPTKYTTYTVSCFAPGAHEKSAVFHGLLFALIYTFCSVASPTATRSA